MSTLKEILGERIIATKKHSKTSVSYRAKCLIPSGTSQMIDRKKSEIGYTYKNCVPCCWPCNNLKGRRLSYKEMTLVIKFRKG